ncbi:hypothetical protein [Saccharibacillus alkalitolerans]|uniref:Suppressor of fused-like domain-containing protein n=1 Tax=Saccharibacillus alkalitolerans TaxID=2705290 RepID=A0ABX0FDM0_9BACL|nr:hypothetical protein [Saccharibacillus alkalitolerans]NGZ77666.1 hypothetical protein [Saccharibacillus alkalitolerans]
MNEYSPDWMSKLPAVRESERIFKAAAMLDALLSPEWEFRYYSYNREWGEGEEMASMRDGEGSHYFALFAGERLMIKGFDHERVESGESAIGIGPVPDEIEEFLREPAFMGDLTTFCLWNLPTNGKWEADKSYSAPDCRLLRILTEEAAYYRDWAAEYFEVELEPETVRRFFDLEPLTPELIALVNDELSLEDLEEDLREIGYPAGV